MPDLKGATNLGCMVCRIVLQCDHVQPLASKHVHVHTNTFTYTHTQYTHAHNTTNMTPLEAVHWGPPAADYDAS